MNKFKLLFGFFLSFLFSPDLKAENVLYCQTEVATGMSNSSGVWKETNFELVRFTIKFNDDYSILEGITKEPMVCKKPYVNVLPSRVTCINELWLSNIFQYDIVSRKFSSVVVSAAGYVHDGENRDTDSIKGGRCEKF